MKFLIASATLWQREIIRFVRDRHRLYGAILQPLLFWVLVGSGLGASFLPAGIGPRISYMEYIFPGTLMLILLFTAIFSTISVVEDRKEGFLQSVLVAPIPRISLIFGKVLGGATLAVMEGILFLLLAGFVGIPLTVTSSLLTVSYLFLLAFALTGLGFTIAWRMDSTAGFHAVMNLFLLPMWLLSGAFFPPSGAPEWLGWIIRLNPLTYGMAGLRRVLYLEAPDLVGEIPSMAMSLGVTLVFAGAMAATSMVVLSRRPSGGSA